MPPVGFEPTISAGRSPAEIMGFIVCDLETSRIGAPYIYIYIYIYIYDISSLMVKLPCVWISEVFAAVMRKNLTSTRDAT
jgi:hypothetical protein